MAGELRQVGNEATVTESALCFWIGYPTIRKDYNDAHCII